MDLEAVGRLGDHDLRLHVRVGGKSWTRGREDDLLGRRAAAARRPAIQTPERLRHVPVGAQRRQRLAGRERRGGRLDAVARGDLRGVPPATGTAQMCRRSMSFALVQ